MDDGASVGDRYEDVVLGSSGVWRASAEGEGTTRGVWGEAVGVWEASVGGSSGRINDTRTEDLWKKKIVIATFKRLNNDNNKKQDEIRFSEFVSPTKKSSKL